MKIVFPACLAALAAPTSAQKRHRLQALLPKENMVDMSMSAPMDVDDVEAIYGGELEPSGKQERYLIPISYQTSEEFPPEPNLLDTYCSSVLIAPRALLTNAECFFILDDAFKAGALGIADFDRDNLQPEGLAPGVIRHFFTFGDDVVIHPDYTPSNFFQPPSDNNLALIILQKPAPPSAKVLKLNRRGSIPGASEDPLTIKGWHSFQDLFRDEDPSDSEKIYIGLPSSLSSQYITNAQCDDEVERLSSPFPGFNFNITDKMICAKAELGKGICLDKADRAAPLIHEGEHGPELVGIGLTSLVGLSPQGRLIPACGLEFPAVFTRISTHVDWIEEVVCNRTGHMCNKSSKAGKAASKASKTAEKSS